MQSNFSLTLKYKAAVVDTQPHSPGEFTSSCYFGFIHQREDATELHLLLFIQLD